MSRIITIGREFGSGGRELGKRLAELLEIPYYDKEIVTEIAKRTQLAEEYVHKIIEHQPGFYFPITTGRTLHTGASCSDYMLRQHTAIYAEKAAVLREMANASDCVIVGRCADYILKDMDPFRIFVYADMDAKIARCRQKGEENGLNDRELKKKILKVDKHRAKYYQYYTGQKWGAREHYDLCINTSIAPIKELSQSLARLIKSES